MAKKRRPPSSIPTDEEFARASALMRSKHEMFDAIRDRILHRFRGRLPLHEIFFFPSNVTDYATTVFYESDHDVKSSEESEDERLLKEAIREEFASARGNPELAPTVAFEFHSYEDVMKNCNGNFYKYLK